MIPNPYIFAAVLLAAIAFFTWSCVRRFSLVTIGKPEDRFNNVAARLRDTFIYAFAQKRVLQKPFGINHFVLFWSFMTLLLANSEFLIHGVVPGHQLQVIA